MPIIHPKGAAAPQGIVCGPPTNVFDVTGGTLTSLQFGAPKSALRQVVPNLSVGGNQVRALFVAGTVSGTLQTTNCSVGIRLSGDDMSTDPPIELLFSDASGFTITAGNQIWSDWANLDMSASEDLLVHADLVSNNSYARRSTITLAGQGRYWKSDVQYWDEAVVDMGLVNTTLYDAVMQVEVRTCV